MFVGLAARHVRRLIVPAGSASSRVLAAHGGFFGGVFGAVTSTCPLFPVLLRTTARLLLQTSAASPPRRLDHLRLAGPSGDFRTALLWSSALAAAAAIASASSQDAKGRLSLRRQS